MGQRHPTAKRREHPRGGGGRNAGRSERHEQPGRQNKIRGRARAPADGPPSPPAPPTRALNGSRSRHDEGRKARFRAAANDFVPAEKWFKKLEMKGTLMQNGDISNKDKHKKNNHKNNNGENNSGVDTSSEPHSTATMMQRPADYVTSVRS